MIKNLPQHLRTLQSRYGIVFTERQLGDLDVERFGYDHALAMDAQPQMVTVSNAGVPAYLVNYLDPQFVQVLVSPMKAEQIFGAAKKGDWTTLTSQFPVAESVGEVSSYGDYSNNGNASTNVNWVPRQSYHFQTITRWGEREIAIAGEAQIDWAARQNIASALTINKAANKIAFFGVAGLQNYGALNDPSLPTPISPNPTGTGSALPWSTKDAAAIYGDLQTLFTKLVAQGNGTIDKNTKMVLAMSTNSETELTKTNQFNVNVTDQLTKNFPNLRIEAAVEYSTVSGELVQLFAENLEGVETAQVCFTEKMRAHPVVVGLSNFQQKKSAGSWGTIWKRPFACAQMLGV